MHLRLVMMYEEAMWQTRLKFFFFPFLCQWVDPGRLCWNSLRTLINVESVLFGPSLEPIVEMTVMKYKPTRW